MFQPLITSYVVSEIYVALDCYIYKSNNYVRSFLVYVAS